jgi:hypothetical protein
MNSLALTLKYVFVDLIGGVIRAPVWWYTSVLKMMAAWMIASVQNYARSISLSVWIKNLFVPMYGQYDWQSRLISFIMRVFMIIGRLIALGVWLMIVLVIGAIYLILPPLAIWELLFHLIGSLV